MKTFLPFVALLLTLSMGAAQCGAGPAAAPAEEAGPSQIMVMEPFARASIPNGAVFLKLMNEGHNDDMLISAGSDIAEAVELHESKMDEQGVMKMSPVPNIPLPAGDTVALQPGGLHIMLIGLKEELAAGDRFSVTLNFEQAGSQTIEVEVKEGLAMGQMEYEGMADEMEDSGHEMEAMDHDQ